jgi:soluble lytic murein transglycosylase
MRGTGIPYSDDRICRVLALWLLLGLGALIRTGWAAPWDPPPPGQAPLPASAKSGVAIAPGAGQPPAGDQDRVRRELGLGVAEVVSGQGGPGADRLARLTGLTGILAEVAAYYQGLGRYLAGQPEPARAVLTGRVGSAFLGRDALYLSILCAAGQGDQAGVMALARAWLASPDPVLAPQVLLRAAVAAQALGDTAQSQDFLRHLSLFAPWTQAAKAGDALARSLRDRAASAGQGPAPAPPGDGPPAGLPPQDKAGPETAWYDPDAPANLLLRAEELAEKGHAGAALDLLADFSGPEPGQRARAEYIRGKALYALRRTQAATEAFARAGAADPASSLAAWALYHQARCLWRSLDPDDARRMEELLRQVLAGPGHDDRLREAAARHLALLLVEQGRFAEALTAAGQLTGLAVSPDLAAQGASLAALLRLVTGDPARAETELAAFAERFPGEEWADGARYWRAKALVALDRADEAAAVLARLAADRSNTYYGVRAATALAALGRAVPVEPAKAPPRCPEAIQPPDPAAAEFLEAAQALDQARLPRLAEMLLEFAARQRPDRTDLALAHIRAADALGRRAAVSRTAWRTFGGCLIRGTAGELAPLRRALYPRAHADTVRAALAGTPVAPDVIFSLIRQESFFDPRAVSGAGAVGLMQLMPDTARAVGKRLGRGVGREELFDPQVNIRLGTAFFLERLDRFGNLPAALAGYNAGENRVARWNRALAPLGEELFIELIPYTETRDYVRRILAGATMYGRLYARP